MECAVPGFAADEVHFTVTGPASVTFDWRGLSSADDKISYGTCSGCESTTVTAYTPSPLPFSSSGPYFEAKLTGLANNTVYYYKIGANAEKTFKTAPPPGGSGFIVTAESDIGDSTSYFNMAIMQNMIATVNPDVSLVAGDITYGADHGQSKVDQHFNDVMVWSQTIPYMPAWGNHEWDQSTDDMRNYLGRFGLPNSYSSPIESSYTTACLQNLGKDWYWFDYGSARFIAYPEPFGNCGNYSSNSMDWTDWFNKVQSVMQDAQNNANIQFIVTWGHRPAYSSGHHPGDPTLKGYVDYLGDHFSKYVLNINGHSHNYERTYPKHGVTHITAGIGGADLEQDGSCLWLACAQPSWSAVRYMRQGVIRLIFGSTGIVGQFICGPAGGGVNDVTCNQADVIDSFTIGTVSSPTASLSANPTSITSGQSSTLTWSSTDAVSCVGTGFSTGNAISGSASVAPSVTATYSVSCTGPGGTATASAMVTVTSAFTYTPSSGSAVSVVAGGSVSQTVTAKSTGALNTSAHSGSVSVATAASNSTIVTSFSGISNSTYPPHSGLCVGPNNIVMIEGTQIEWTNLTGGSPTLQSVYAFFSSLNPTGGLYDQRCAYDAVNGRFVVIMQYQGSPDGSDIDIAVSKDSNPNDGWYFAKLNSATVNGQQTLSDRPSLAVDGVNIYITAAQFGSGYLGTEVWVIGDTAGPGGGIYNGGTLTQVANELLPSSQGEYFVVAGGNRKAYFAADWLSGGQTVLGLQTYDVASKTFGPSNTITLGAIDQGVTNTAQQQGTTLLLNVGDGRVASLAYLNGVLAGVAQVTPIASSAPLVHWFQIDVSNPLSPALLAQGNISGAAIGTNAATFTPSLAVDAAGDIIMNFTASGPSMYPAAYFVYRTATDPPGSFSAPVLYHASTGYYQSSDQRWGLNSSAVVDPNNPNSFWLSGEYVANAWWQTAVAQVAIGGGTAMPTASLSASPTSITSGQSSTLTWSSTNATSCTGTGFSTGGATSGSVSVSPTVTTTYSVSCTGSSGTATANATVTVTAPFAYTLSNGGGVSVAAGSSVSQTVTATLTAGATQSVSYSVTGLPSGAALSFPSCSPTCTSSGTITTSPSTPAGSYAITVTGSPNGVATSFSLTVNAASNTTASLSANPTSITSGQSSTLTWSSTNATSCTGTGFSTGGATSGSASVSPTVTTTYSVSCTNGATSASASATVTVAASSISKHFDLNTGASGSGTSPTAPGYTGVPLIAYSPTLGHGWQSTTSMDSRDRTDVSSKVGPLREDFHKSTGASGAYDSHFLVDLPNGAYNVTVYIGDGDVALTNQYVDAQGVNVVGPVNTTSCATGVATCSQSFTFPVSVTSGQLNLRFYTTNSTSVYYGYIAVEGIDIVATQ